MSIQNYSENIIKSAEFIKNADYILIGAGAGLSAAAGLNYNDTKLFKKWYPQLSELDIKTLAQAISHFWQVSDSNRNTFWAYWASHIKRIRYDFSASKPYLNLFDIIKNKPYFVITTNVDHQFVKAGFNKSNIFTPQGNYGLFQCDQPCCDEVFYNKVMVDKMVLNMDIKKFLVQEIDIPHCPKCGSYLAKNLRIDYTFVEKPHMKEQQDYINFINNSFNGKLVLLELGVGFNTPSIIRWPFESILSKHPNATLIRININHPGVPKKLLPKSLCFSDDISEVIIDIKSTKV